jgi:hypothetical protein
MLLASSVGVTRQENELPPIQNSSSGFVLMSSSPGLVFL